ncbi:hypothetical protein SQ11_05080 [Nitrosospira sp. NpAV]|nr:hypothetical protein SQ11_05080 [Nitrosospira sp. NpAV]
MKRGIRPIRDLLNMLMFDRIVMNIIHIIPMAFLAKVETQPVIPAFAGMTEQEVVVPSSC